MYLAVSYIYISLRYLYGMKLCNLTSDPKNVECIRLDKKYKKNIFLILGGPYGSPNLGSAEKSQNLSTLGHYWTVNKTIKNFCLSPFKSP